MKRIIILLISLMSVLIVSAQEDVLSRRIEVTRDYIPETERTVKLDIEPRMTDTVMLHPHVEYSITPTAWMSIYNPDPISSVGVVAAKWERPNVLSAELGMGMPLQSLANIYYTPVSRGQTSFGLYLNHDGYEGKIKNVYGDKRQALMNDSRVGAYTVTRFEQGGDMEFGIEYRARAYDPYGGYSFTGTDVDYGGRIKYNDFNGKFEIGSDFSDMSRFNARLGVSGGYFGNTTKGLEGRYAQWNFNAFVDLSFNLIGKPLMLGFEFDTENGLDALADNSRNSYKASALYSLAKSRKLSFDAGLRYVYNNSNYIFPVLKLKYAVKEGIKPYIDIDGGVIDNSFRSLSFLNPYIVSGLWAEKYNSHLDMRAGVDVTSSVVDFDVNVGYDMHDNYNIFVNIDKSSRFDLFSAKARIFYISAVADVYLARHLSMDMSFRYNNVSTQKADDFNLQKLYDGVGIPDYIFGACLKYDNGKLSIKTGADFIGERSFASAANASYNGSIVSYDGVTFFSDVIDGCVNLFFEGRYGINKNLQVFVKGENLLGQNIYRYNYYPAPKINFMAGVSVNF